MSISLNNHFTFGKVYSVWLLDPPPIWRIRDDLNQLVSIHVDSLNSYFVSIEDYRNSKLEMIGI
jgi:hypothetical protein